MASKYGKSRQIADENTSTFFLPAHFGEPHESWWLNKDRQSFTEKAKEETPRIVNSAMSRWLGKNN